MATVLSGRWNGTKEIGIECAHSCGNSRCVNPWHLTRVTSKTNQRQKGHKGFHWDGSHWHRTVRSDCDCEIPCLAFTSSSNNLPTVPVVPGALPQYWEIPEGETHICLPVGGADVQQVREVGGERG